VPGRQAAFSYVFLPPSFTISTILFTNTPEFLSRILKAATAQGLKIEARPAEYCNAAKYSGKTGCFRKQAACFHQHEYRIAIEPGMEDALLFDVGGPQRHHRKSDSLCERRQGSQVQPPGRSDAGLVCVLTNDAGTAK
jgi:hypothetical protein